MVEDARGADEEIQGKDPVLTLTSLEVLTSLFWPCTAASIRDDGSREIERRSGLRAKRSELDVVEWPISVASISRFEVLAGAGSRSQRDAMWISRWPSGRHREYAIREACIPSSVQASSRLPICTLRSGARERDIPTFRESPYGYQKLVSRIFRLRSHR